MISDLIRNHFIEIFGAVTGILYVFLEIRQTNWLWPVGIVTSAVYIWVFFKGKLYADMSLQGYYLVISILGWYWWAGGTKGRRARRGERVTGDTTKAQDRYRTVGCVCYPVYGNVDCADPADRFTSPCQRFVHYLPINNSNLDACTQNI